MTKYPGITGTLLCIFLWDAVVRLGFVDSFFVPTPLETVATLFALLYGGTLFVDIIATIGRVLLVCALAIPLGISLGLVCGSSPYLYRATAPLVDFFRSTPSTALFPLFLILFGITDASKIAVATFASAIIVLFNTAYGVQHVHQSRVLATTLMGATRKQLFWHILWFESLPFTFVGIRSAVSMSFIVIVVTEMFIGTTSGLGKEIITAQITYEVPTMYAIILLCGMLGYAVNLLCSLLETRYVHWTKHT